MLTESDRAILDENYHSCVMGTQAINTLIHKVTDEKLALELNREACKCTNLARKVTDKLAMEYETPGGECVNKAMLWTELQLQTLKNASNEHVAELMIQRNAMAVTDLMKVVKANKSARKDYCELAEEIMDFYEKCIENLKSYLK